MPSTQTQSSSPAATVASRGAPDGSVSGSSAPTGGLNRGINAPPSTGAAPDFGDGLLNLVEGYGYNEEQIMKFLRKVATQKTGVVQSEVVRTVASGIQTFLLTANNDKTETLAVGQNKNIGRKRIAKASEAQLQGPNSLAQVPSIPAETSALSSVGNPLGKPSNGRSLPFPIQNGVDLPMITIYDYLAWLLSILGTSELQGVEKTEESYYVPLLAMFSRWCSIISNTIKFASLPMVHIAWWDKNVLLGATLGDAPLSPPKKVIPKKYAQKKSNSKSAAVAKIPDTGTVPAEDESNDPLPEDGLPNTASLSPGKAAGGTAAAEKDDKFEIYVRPRQVILDRLGFHQPPAASTQRSGNTIGTQSYGRCAETFFFIVAKTKGLSSASVKGFALQPPPVNTLPMNEAIKSVAGNAQYSAVVDSDHFTSTYTTGLQYQPSRLCLDDPCEQSCQDLCRQLGWNWQPVFGINNLQQTLQTSVDWLKADKKKPEQIGLGGKGEGLAGKKPPDMTAKQILDNTGAVFATPLLQAAGPHLVAGLAPRIVSSIASTSRA